MDLDSRQREAPSSFPDLTLEPKQHRIPGSLGFSRVEPQVVVEREFTYRARPQMFDDFFWGVGTNPAWRGITKIVEKDPQEIYRAGTQ